MNNSMKIFWSTYRTVHIIPIIGLKCLKNEVRSGAVILMSKSKVLKFMCLLPRNFEREFLSPKKKWWENFQFKRYPFTGMYLMVDVSWYKLLIQILNSILLLLIGQTDHLHTVYITNNNSGTDFLGNICITVWP